MNKPRQLPTGTFQARYIDENGSRRSAGTFATEQEAANAIQQGTRPKESPNDPHPAEMSLKRYAA